MIAELETDVAKQNGVEKSLGGGSRSQLQLLPKFGETLKSLMLTS